jgi:hypothetical protein
MRAKSNERFAISENRHDEIDINPSQARVQPGGQYDSRRRALFLW